MGVGGGVGAGIAGAGSYGRADDPTASPRCSESIVDNSADRPRQCHPAAATATATAAVEETEEPRAVAQSPAKGARAKRKAKRATAYWQGPED